MSAPWTDFELQCLYDVVNDINWYEQVRDLLPARSEAAARAKMCALRREAGIMPRHNGPKATSYRQSHREALAIASKRLADRCNALRERMAA